MHSKVFYHRTIAIEKWDHSRYTITENGEVFRFGNFDAAADFANFILEDRERARQEQIRRLQNVDGDSQPVIPPTNEGTGDSGPAST